MSDKELISRGAECVCGDLILKRVTVGMYRHGQFILTPEGADELANVVDVQAVVVPPAAPKLPKAPKLKAPAATSLSDDLDGLDDILKA